jgi:hypothetical protein
MIMEYEMKLFFAALLLCFSKAHADSFYVNDIQSKDITATDKQSVEELIRQSIPHPHNNVANSKEAQWTLTPKLLKLGDSYILILNKSNTKTGRNYGDKMKSATMSDMDLTASRLTEAVINEHKIENTADVTNITQEEMNQNVNRIRNTRQWLIGIGPSWTNNLNSSGGGFTFLLGFEWGLDPDFSVDLSWLSNHGQGDDDSGMSDFSLGGTYYLSRKKYSPFINVRLGYGSADVNDGCSFFCSPSVKDPTGWIGSLGVGYKFFRTSSVNLSPMLRYSQMFSNGPLGTVNMTSFLIVVSY